MVQKFEVRTIFTTSIQLNFLELKMILFASLNHYLLVYPYKVALKTYVLYKALYAVN